ncbi:MAG: SPOR domain-containing protein, partial [Prevotellaceae bacterium]|nr:SPOR domain-containing protein [Prevotellaceae bacterium]
EKSEEKISENTNVTIEKPATPSKPKKTYSVQIMAINKIISTTARDFKGYKNVRYMKIGNYYKYIIGDFENINDARKLCKSLQKDFKGAFVVAVEGDNLTIAR